MRRAPINVLESSILLFAGALPLWPSFLVLKFQQALPGVNLTRALLFLALLLCLGALLINSAYRERLSGFLARHYALVFFILLPLYAWKMMTVGFSADRIPSSLAALKDVVFELLFFLMCVVVWPDNRSVRRVVVTLLVASSIVTGLALVERALERNLFADITPESFANYRAVAAGLVRDSRYRVWATFSHPLALASYAAVVIPLALWYASANRGLRRYLGNLVSVGLIICIYLSRSRGGVVVLASMTGGYMLMTFLPRAFRRVTATGRLPVVVITAIVAVLALGATGLTTFRLATGRTDKEAGSSSIRVRQMELGAPLIKNRPLVGYGPGESAAVLGLKARTVDNYYLTLSLESGLPAVLLFVVLLGYFIRLAFRLQSALPPPQSGLAAAILWSMVGNAIFLTVLSLEQTMPLLFMEFAGLVTLESGARST